MTKSRNHYYQDNVYIAQVLRVIDGDTVHLLVDMGLRVYREVYLRLSGINAPELRRGTEEEREAGRASRQALENHLGEKILFIRFEKGKSFDRWIGEIYLNDPITTSVNDWMVAEGYAVESER